AHGERGGKVPGHRPHVPDRGVLAQVVPRLDRLATRRARTLRPSTGAKLAFTWRSLHVLQAPPPVARFTPDSGMPGALVRNRAPPAARTKKKLGAETEFTRSQFESAHTKLPSPSAWA